MAVTTPDPEAAEPLGNGLVCAPMLIFLVRFQIHKIRNTGGGFQPSGGERDDFWILTDAHIWEAPLESFLRDTDF